MRTRTELASSSSKRSVSVSIEEDFRISTRETTRYRGPERHGCGRDRMTARSSGSKVRSGVVFLICAALWGACTSGDGSGQEREDARRSLHRIQAALEYYRVEHGRYPSKDEGLDSLLEPSIQTGDPYLLDVTAIVDPWGQRIRFEPSGESGYTVCSWGEDGEPGGGGAAEDLCVEVP